MHRPPNYFSQNLKLARPLFSPYRVRTCVATGEDQFHAGTWLLCGDHTHVPSEPRTHEGIPSAVGHLHLIRSFKQKIHLILSSNHVSIPHHHELAVDVRPTPATSFAASVPARMRAPLEPSSPQPPLGPPPSRPLLLPEHLPHPFRATIRARARASAPSRGS